ncbi:hypothetical protein QBC38DRAFT_455586 [Podospora fimiseda]|uniref:Uncharacterized protein n=1 Tax=Podospora fimiseda TaxID=252190 RepID=A0AAN7GU62_9PEZI|nr:hypothetical protein QBC38DRAFT_455586 [Podospora fimiseda]
MVSYRIFAFVGLAAALPLNINLGAYSPALVVGDGEISFGGRQDVSDVLLALEGAAINAAAGAAAEAESAKSSASSASVSAAAVPPPATAEAAAKPAPDPALTEQAHKISGLQGLGKSIAPRPKDKRDLAGFDRALTYAEAALVKGPRIQLGTGAEGSGVGIIVDNNAANGAAVIKKREDNDENAAAPRRRSKVTTLYVRRGVPAALQRATTEEATEDKVLPAEPAVPVAKRDVALDAVNLNVDGGAGVTMTFVETFDNDDDDE